MSSLLVLVEKLLGDLHSFHHFHHFYQVTSLTWGSGTKYELEKLGKTLSTIEAVLFDAEAKQGTDQAIQDWLTNIRYVCYDAEDFLQELSTETLRRQMMLKKGKSKMVRIFSSPSHQIAHLVRIGREIKLIREKLDAFASQAHTLKLNQRPKEMLQVEMEEGKDHSFVTSDKVFVRYEDKHHVTKLLLEPQSDVSFISIVGIPGLGKTTLAQLVYNSYQVRQHFDLMMWVSVSGIFHIERICKEIISSATGKMCKNRQMDAIESELNKVLNRRKYLLVLDDPWNGSPVEWMKLEKLLKAGAKGSKVLITAQSESVALAAKSIAIHRLPRLSKDDSWMLFNELALTQGQPPESSAIVEIEKKIVEKCAGVPRTIKNVGLILRFAKNVNDWLEFQENDLPRIIRRRRESPLYYPDIDPILSLEISLNLKLKFFHFSRFPNIRQGQRFEQVLFHSHDYLVSMEEIVQSGGKQEAILRTKTSDISMFEDAIIGISEAELDEASGQEKVVVQSKEVVMIKISSLPEKPSFPNLTILLFQKDKSRRKLSDSFFSNMPSLKILDLSETRLRSLPSSLFKLTALEALLLRDFHNLDNLQADIGDLRSIKVLDLKGTELFNLPKEVNNLTKLEFLRVSFYGAYDPSEYSSLPPQLISTMSNLQSLKALSIIVHPSDWRWNDQADALTYEVGGLCELTYLQFYFTQVRLVELFMEISPSWAKNTLCKFKFIVGQDIDRIVWRVPEKVVSEFDKHDRCLRYVNGDEIPRGFVGLLVRVTAFYLDHHCAMKNLSEFGHDNFMELKFCVVRECPEVVAIINNSEGSDGAVLPNIQHLSLHYLWKLENLWKGSVPQGSFSCLKFLSVYACHKLEALLTRPLLRCFNKLEELVVEDCALLKAIIAREEDDEMVRSRDMFFPSMTNLNLHYLPELTNVWLGDCPLLKPTGISIIGCPKIAQHSGNSGEIVELNTT